MSLTKFYSSASKFLAIVLVLLCGLLSAYADTTIRCETFDFIENDYNMPRVSSASDDYLDDNTSFSQGGINVILNRRIVSGWQLTERGLQVDYHKGNTMKLIAGGRKITSVHLYWRFGNVSASLNGEGMLTYIGKEIEFSPNNTETLIEFKVSSVDCLLRMDVSYEEQINELQDPELRFEKSEYEAILEGYFETPKLHKLTDAPALYKSSNPEVAIVDEKTGKVELRSLGKTIISAHCDGTQVYKSGYAEYELNVIGQCISISDVYSQTPGTKCVISFPLQVEYVNGNRTYVRADNDVALIRNCNIDYQKGDIIPYGWIGRYELNHGVPEIVSSSEMRASEKNVDVSFEEVDFVDDSMLNEIVILRSVYFEDSTPAGEQKDFFTGMCGNIMYTFINEFSDVPSVGAGYYDVLLAVSIYDNHLRLFPIDYIQCVSSSPIIKGDDEFLVSTQVTISAGNMAEIYYAIEGNDGISDYQLYTTPLYLTESANIFAYSIEPGKKASEVVSAKFIRKNSGINDVYSEDADAILCFDLFGLKVNNPSSGVCIKVYNGKVVKVLY